MLEEKAAGWGWRWTLPDLVTSQGKAVTNGRAQEEQRVEVLLWSAVNKRQCCVTLLCLASRTLVEPRSVDTEMGNHRVCVKQRDRV